jgi:hypothetical protein
MKQVRFGRTLLLSDSAPSSAVSGIEWQAIPLIRSRTDYSRFMLHELTKYVTSDFALIVQWDGYVLNAAEWDQRFLEFDYIGASWPQFSDQMVVGNGGFSLRSKQLLEACAELPFSPDAPEDVLICRTFRCHLERHHGIRFAPKEIADHFAFERCQPSGQTFGFHGIFNLMKMLPPRIFADILAGLEPGVLGKREAGEILRFAATRGEWRAALIAMRSLLVAGRSRALTAFRRKSSTASY